MNESVVHREIMRCELMSFGQCAPPYDASALKYLSRNSLGSPEPRCVLRVAKCYPRATTASNVHFQDQLFSFTGLIVQEVVDFASAIVDRPARLLLVQQQATCAS